MRYRTLGRTGVSVSEIGLGSWSMGGGWGERDDTSALAALHRAIDLGINFFDTALAYGDGHAERLIGRVLKERREPVIAATKIPPMNREWPARADVPLSEVFPAKWITRCTERSLKNLGVDALDLTQLHVWADRWLDEPDWLEVLKGLQAEGKVRFIGVSINDHEPKSALRLVRSGAVDTLQVIYNLFDQSPAKELFPAAQEREIGIIARCPFDEGALSGRLTPETVFHPDDWRRDYFAGERLCEALERAERFRFLIRDEIATPAQAALKFCLSHPAVGTVIPGMRRPEHVEENVRASDGCPLRPEELAQARPLAWVRNFY